MIEAQVSRRDVLKFSALGAAAVALPLERVVRAKTVSQIAASKLPAPYTLPFAVPPVIDGRGGGVVRLEQTASRAAPDARRHASVVGLGLGGPAGGI
jgi:TAT (twin-arginine translocation) pathway signal sequence